MINSNELGYSEKETSVFSYKIIPFLGRHIDYEREIKFSERVKDHLTLHPLEEGK